MVSKNFTFTQVYIASLFLTSSREFLCVDDFGGEFQARGLLHAPSHHGKGASEKAEYFLDEDF